MQSTLFVRLLTQCYYFFVGLDQCIADRSSGLQQQVAVDSSTMTGQQTSACQLTTTPMTSVEQPQVHVRSDTNMRVAPAIGHQGVEFHANPSSGGSTQQQQQTLAAAAVPVADQMSARIGVPATPSKAEALCLMCGKTGGVFTCNGGCGLRVHPTCIGEDAIFPFIGEKCS